MRSLLFGLLVVLVVSVHGHAVLKVPVPMNPNPTTQQPCGVAAITSSMQNAATAEWSAGSEIQITWNLIASDGGGTVSGAFDPNGGTNFSVKAWNTSGTTQYDTSGSNKIYTFTFTVPSALDCSNSPSGLCTFQVHSPNWFSCAMVSIIPKNCDNCKEAKVAPHTCVSVDAGDAPLCPNVTSSYLIQGTNPADVNLQASSAYKANLASPLVFGPGANTSTQCLSLYKTLVCSVYFPPCNTTTTGPAIAGQVCHSQCQQTMDACGVQEAHINLYPCSQYPLCPGEKAANAGGSGSGSSSGGMSPGGKAALSLFFIALAAGGAFAGYMYYKQGHLFGYAFDKHSMKFVKHQANPHNYQAYVDHEAQ